MSASALSISDARALLGLHGPADGRALKAAFRASVKAARPDLPGGDAERFRCVIDAYRLLQTAPGRLPALAAPAARAKSPALVGLTPQEALNGGSVRIRLDGRTLRISVPPGLRTGEHLRLRGAARGSDLYLPVLIRPGDGLAALGDDLFMRWPVAPRLIEDGGRVEIETHAGLRPAWIAPGLTGPVRLRLKGLGLPARGARPQGHLFVTLDLSEDAPSAAEDLLARFTRVWTPDRLAA